MGMGNQAPTVGLTEKRSSEMRAFIFLLGVVPSLNALCAIQGCDKWYNTVKNNASVTGACAVMFDENCCKASKTFHVVKKGEEGKLCGTVSSLNPFSSCKGPKLKDDIDSLSLNFCRYGESQTSHLGASFMFGASLPCPIVKMLDFIS